MRNLALALLVITVGGCPAITYDYSKEPDPRKSEFVLGASDALRITVWKNPELSTDARIRPDGTITMPLVGDVQAAGKTPNQLREAIAKRLSTYVKDETSVVTIAVTEVNSYRYTVSGNVERGGVFTSRHYVTVLEAIAQAGGLNRFASPKKLVLVRAEPGQPPRRIPLDYDRVASGNYPEENLVMMAGDTLFAP